MSTITSHRNYTQGSRVGGQRRKRVSCKLADSVVVAVARIIPVGYELRELKLTESVHGRGPTLSMVSPAFPVHPLGLLPLPRWGLFVWNHALWILLTSQLLFRLNLGQVSGVTVRHNPFTQHLTGKKDYFLWNRMTPVVFCSHKAPHQAEPHAGGSIPPCHYPTTVWPLHRIRHTLSLIL